MEKAFGPQWPVVRIYIEEVTASFNAQISELQASLAEHQRLSDKAIADAKVEIKALAGKGADVRGLVAVLTDAATPMAERQKAAIKAEIDAAAELIRQKQTELESL